MKILSLLLRASRGRFAFAVLFGLLSGFASARLIALINEGLTREGPLDSVLVWHFVAAVLLALVTRGGSHMLLSRLHYGALYELRMRLCRRMLAAPLRQLEVVGEHRLMAALQDDASTISQGLIQLPQLLINVAIVLGCFGYLAWMSPRILLSLAVVLAVGVTLYVLMTRRAIRLVERARDTLDTLFRHFESLGSGMKELKLHRRRREAFLQEELAPTAATIRDLFIRNTDVTLLSWAWGYALNFALIGLLLFLFPHLGLVDRKTLVGFTLVTLYVQQPLDGIMNLFHMVARANIAVRKVEGLGLSLADEGSAPAAELPEPRTFQRLELVGVTHTYQRENDDTRFTLGPIHLTLAPGEILYVVGGNGSGKTTLAKLLTGLYVPESGEIRVDGQPVTEASRDQYRQHFATVFSDFHLFQRLLGLTSAELIASARALLTRLQLDRKVRIDDGSLSTTALSQGQRKRLALLTAYLESRPIYLFDEWAADQDPAFKEVFYKELLPELKRAGRTAIVISHDDRYFHLADRLVRLESGQLVAGSAQPAPVQKAAS